MNNRAFPFFGRLELRLINPSEKSIKIPLNNCLTLSVCLPKDPSQFLPMFFLPSM
jgi:hypothetical protein